MDRIKKATANAALVISIAATVPLTLAQPFETPTGQEALLAIEAHRACVIAYAEKFSATNEQAGDIATGAIPGCRGMLNDFLNKVFKTDDAKFQMRLKMEKIAYELAVRAVMEKRYPNIK